MERTWFISALLVFSLTTSTGAHEIGDTPLVVIDTDMGLDDAVALAAALQSVHVEVAAIVACEGVAGGPTAVQCIERMLERFNRGDIQAYAPVGAPPASEPPPFRHNGSCLPIANC